jgi:hypothetical protein
MLFVSEQDVNQATLHLIASRFLLEKEGADAIRPHRAAP